jgi:hypothetical protein
VRAHVVLEVCVGPRGEEEFHDAGVTTARGVDESRRPILKERTKRERARWGVEVHMCRTRAKCAKKKNQVHMVRKIPKY